MKKIPLNTRLRAKSLFTLLLLFGTISGSAQPDLSLSMADFFSWQPSSVNAANISNVSIAPRVMAPNYQLANGLDTNTRILYAPDGMDNFGPYIDSADQFNLFNFSHWQYIDILAWFGGSAGAPVLIPAKSWVDAAHKNGVKVIGTVFMAPAAFGGSQAIMQNFLQQDAGGNFPAAAKLIEIANYYHFDGWILNFETSVNSATGALAALFVHKLDSAYNGELIWYDALLQSGSVSYQNRLNANNAYFFQNSTGLFTNYNWNAAAVTSSAAHATSLGLSPFKVYMGADMWPARTAQPAFTDYTWIDQIIVNNIARTSIALFATNFTFNYAAFSTFNNNAADYNSFYAAERKIFSGVDQDPFTADNNSWKGIANYVPVRTTIRSFPFITDFNTGHGLNYYSNGSVLSAGPWHNMSLQATLPSWTFYANGITAGYDFTKVYSGGSSLAVAGTAAGTYSIPLYSTAMLTGTNSLYAKIALQSSSSTIDSVGISLQKKNGQMLTAIFHPALNGSWEALSHAQLASGNADTIVAIRLNVYSSGAFEMNVGSMEVGKNAPNSIAPIKPMSPLVAVYPNPSTGTVYIELQDASEGQLNVYDLAGKSMISRPINIGPEKIVLPVGVYIYEVNTGKEFERGKIVVAP